MRTITLLLTAISSIIAFAQTPDEIIGNVKKQYAPDTRVAIWEIASARDADGILTLTGKVDNAAAAEAISTELERVGIECRNNITVLPDDATLNRWALVALPFVHTRAEARHGSELLTQSLMGSPLRVLERSGEWVRVQSPDGYIGWVVENGLAPLDEEQLNAWKKSFRFIVTCTSGYLYKDAKCGEILSNLVLGDILQAEEIGENLIALRTPDNRIGYVRAADVAPFAEWAKQEFNPRLIINTARRLLGSTYLWGGTSTAGVDCSGLTKLCYFANGVILQRDASQQVLYGGKIAPEQWREAQPADLLYFGNKKGRVTHTAIYMGDGKYIHSSGRVKINSVDPEAPDYLSTPFLSINRINGYVGTPGIVAVKAHPWYF